MWGVGRGDCRRNMSEAMWLLQPEMGKLWWLIIIVCCGHRIRERWHILCLSQPLASQINLCGPAAAAKLLQSCPTLCDPIDGSPPGSPVPGILQARTLEWGAISFSNAWKWKVKGKSLSHVRFLATPWTAAYQALLSMGFAIAFSLWAWGASLYNEESGLAASPVPRPHPLAVWLTPPWVVVVLVV